MSLLLAIDQRTFSSRTMIFSPDGYPEAQAQEEFPQNCPANGWVENDPEDIWRTVIETARMAVNRLGARASEIISIGITNQRETVILWDRKSGKPIYNAIVWQDRHTADICADLKEKDHEDLIRNRTGLLLDPYFSATKIAWILDRVEGVLRVDGGMVLNDWAMQFLADISELTVARPKVMESTALGAAILAGVQQGLYPSLEDAGRIWRQDRQFIPAMARTQRDAMLSGWQQAVRRTLCV